MEIISTEIDLLAESLKPHLTSAAELLKTDVNIQQLAIIASSTLKKIESFGDIKKLAKGVKNALYRHQGKRQRILLDGILEKCGIEAFSDIPIGSTGLLLWHYPGHISEDEIRPMRLAFAKIEGFDHDPKTGHKIIELYQVSVEEFKYGETNPVEHDSTTLISEFMQPRAVKNRLPMFANICITSSFK